MRRPRFKRWIFKELQDILGTNGSFNLRKAAWQVQQEHNPKLSAALFLYAHENDALERLFSFVYDSDLTHEYQMVQTHLGTRSIERLALRGSPMMQLPEAYRRLLTRYERAYHAPEYIAEEKQRLCKASQAALLHRGLSSTEVAHTLHLEPGNVHAYLVRGDIGRFTLEGAQGIYKYLCQQR